MKPVAVALLAVLTVSGAPRAAQISDQQAFDRCMKTAKNAVAITCSYQVLKRCVERTKNRVKCDEEDQARLREQNRTDLTSLIRKSDVCMVQWSKAYAVATQEQVSTVIDAAFTKCAEYTGPLSNVMTGMTQSAEGAWAETYKKKFTATVLDARMKVGSGTATTPEQPKIKSF